MKANLNFDNIEELKQLAVSNWIYKQCKMMLHEHNKYSDLSGYYNHVTKQHYRNIKSVDIDWLIPLDSIIVVIKYLENKKPARVYFIETQDEPTTHDYYVSKNVFDFSKIKIK